MDDIGVQRGRARVRRSGASSVGDVSERCRSIARLKSGSLVYCSVLSRGKERAGGVEEGRKLARTPCGLDRLDLRHVPLRLSLLQLEGYDWNEM